MLNEKFELYKLQQLRKNGFECQEEQEYQPQTSQKQSETEDKQDIEEIRAYGKQISRLNLVIGNQQSTSYMVTIICKCGQFCELPILFFRQYITLELR